VEICSGRVQGSCQQIIFLSRVQSCRLFLNVFALICRRNRATLIKTKEFIRHLSLKSLNLTGRNGVSSEMSDSILVTNISGSDGNSPVLLGLFEYFQVRNQNLRLFA